MSNVFFKPALEEILRAGIDLEGGDIRAILIDASLYTVDETHEFLSSVAAGARVGSAVALAGNSVTDGVFNCSSPVTFTAPPSGRQVDAWLIYDHAGGADAARRLIAYIDTGYNLPLQTNGNDVRIQIDSGTNKVFRLYVP